jgi:serine/threonine protein kinase
MIGQTLDGKYSIERELGRGGMGTVYLATHMGTERPVAVKIIAPQFMERPEFVERFRREARAAGRLRHPNVVDVTDFGFANVDDGRVAYLVMEYLDGCTLGEILDEERNLPVGWTLDILEQVCSAVQEAHEQGIIHRDLKPDNIWLEPNQRGGYTVKVLDFGIAKLEVHPNSESEGSIHLTPPLPMSSGSARATQDGWTNEETIHDNIPVTIAGEAATIAFPTDGATLVSEKLTVRPEPLPADGGIINVETDPSAKTDQDSVTTRLITEVNAPGATDTAKDPEHRKAIDTLATRDLTRVGAVLGTPLFMSPEQCRGEKLDARSDVYSLGVIAYQMLDGKTPFTGDFTEVMAAHRELPPPPLAAKKVRRKLKRVILSALSKNPDERPQTAEAFATILRSRSEGIFGLLRRAGMIYTEHITKFILLSALFHIPLAVLTPIVIVLSFLKASELISSLGANIGLGVTGTILTLATALCTFFITGTISWVVIQSLAVPLRPIRLRAALREARKKWKTFAGAGILNTIVSVASGIILCIAVFVVLFLLIWLITGSPEVGAVAGLVVGAALGSLAFLAVSVLLMLAVPVAMMENVGAVSALRRSKELVKRSPVTAFSAFLIMFLIPAVSAGLISFFIGMTAKALDPDSGKPAAAVEQSNKNKTGEQAEAESEKPRIGISVGNQRVVELSGPTKDIRSRIKDSIFETLMQIILLPLQIFVTSFTAIIFALLYLKTRQAGGESLEDLLAKFEETDQPRKKWQERVRQRLIQSGRVSNSSKS